MPMLMPDAYHHPALFWLLSKEPLFRKETMSSKIRCKFVVTSIVDDGHSEALKHVTLEARYDDKLPEDQKFMQYTPSGKLTAAISNPRALEQLAVGREFYLDLTPCIEEQPPAPAAPESVVPPQ